ncbi:nonstructural protein [Chifec microvirus UA13_14]|nr:nonstructural protein [Chifec microvirus UA13_14]
MVYKIIAVRDRAVDAFGVPVFVANLGGAIRSFGDEVKRVDPNNNMNKHPDDYDLYHIGEYDDSTAEFSAIRPTMIAVGKDYV